MAFYCKQLICVYSLLRHQRHVIPDFFRIKIKSGCGIEILKISQISFKNLFSLLLAVFTTYQLTYCYIYDYSTFWQQKLIFENLPLHMTFKCQ
jgi:hypothetical protein